MLPGGQALALRHLFSYLALRATSAESTTGRSAPAAQAQDAAPTSSALPTQSGDATEPEPPILAVYGDGYSTGNPLGGLDAAGWPALVGQGLEADLRLHAVSKAGYAAIGTTGLNLSAVVGQPHARRGHLRRLRKPQRPGQHGRGGRRSRG